MSRYAWGIDAILLVGTVLFALAAVWIPVIGAKLAATSAILGLTGVIVMFIALVLTDKEKS